VKLVKQVAHIYARTLITVKRVVVGVVGHAVVVGDFVGIIVVDFVVAIGIRYGGFIVSVGIVVVAPLTIVGRRSLHHLVLVLVVRFEDGQEILDEKLRSVADGGRVETSCGSLGSGPSRCMKWEPDWVLARC